MRVLHVLCSNSFSGAENVACQIINMFKNNSDVEMIYVSPNGMISKALEERNIKFYPLYKISFSELKKAIDDIKPDIIHAHDMRASFFAALVCKNIKLISHIHNNSFDSRKITLKAVLYQLQAKKYSHIFWVSQAAFDGYYFKNKVCGKSSILRNLIDISEVQKKAQKAEISDSYDIIYLGRLSYEKNPERVVDIISMIANIYPNIKVALVGQGELHDNIEKRINELHLTANISLLGFQSNPYGLLANSKLMVMTSRWEGLPMCALEAMSLGIPIVSTPTDGLKEIVDYGITGYLENTDAGLSEKCLNIITNDKLRSDLSKGAYDKALKIMNLDDYRKAIFNEYTR